MALVNTIDAQRAQTALTAWLTKQLPSASGVHVSDVSIPTANGLCNEILFFTASWQENGSEQAESLVARIQPLAAGIFRVSDPRTEAHVMAAVAEHTSVAIPRVLWQESDPAVLGAPFVVIERVDGKTPPDDPPFPLAGWVLELSDDEQARLSDNALRQLAAIHQTDWQAAGLGFLADRAVAGHDHPSPERGSVGLSQQLAYWQELFEWAAAGRPYPTIEAALEWARECRPSETAPPVLNWGDARTGNMIFADDLSVAGVLDWEMATLAQPELDLGWWLFLLRHHSEGMGASLPPGFPSRDQTIARYQELTGHQVRDLEYYEAFAALRLSITVIRAGQLMIDAGLLPPDSTMPANNPASQLLAQMLDLPAPAGTTTSYVGNR